MNSRKSLNSRTLNRFFWVVLFLGLITIGILIHKELTAPLPEKPVAVNTEPPPAIEPKSIEAKAAYTVSPTHPRQLMIPKLGIDANIHPVGLVDGAIDAPPNAWDVGWYTNSSLPGKPGSLLLDGHVNDALDSPGVFAKLHNLQYADEVRVERGDKTLLQYRITDVRQIPLKDLDMKQLLKTDASEERIILITCGGAYDKARQTYSDRIIVIAQRAS